MIPFPQRCRNRIANQSRTPYRFVPAARVKAGPLRPASRSGIRDTDQWAEHSRRPGQQSHSAVGIRPAYMLAGITTAGSPAIDLSALCAPKSFPMPF